MKVKNISNTVVGIGNSVMLLPDNEVSISNEAASAPAIKVLVKAGILALDHSDEKQAAPVPEPAPEAPSNTEQTPANAPATPEGDNQGSADKETTPAANAAQKPAKAVRKTKSQESAPSA